MAAPATTARSTPGGTKLDDGFSTKIAFSVDPDVSFWEVTVKPPGIDGGEKIDTTTMFNGALKTFAARTLKQLTDGGASAAYDPQAYLDILSLVNVEGSVTVHWPDGSTLDFYGYLNKFEPGDNTEGEMPKASINFCCTNWDSVNNLEVGPVYTAPA